MGKTKRGKEGDENKKKRKNKKTKKKQKSFQDLKLKNKKKEREKKGKPRVKLNVDGKEESQWNAPVKRVVRKPSSTKVAEYLLFCLSEKRGGEMKHFDSIYNFPSTCSNSTDMTVGISD